MSIMTPKRLLEKLLRGYVGTRYIISAVSDRKRGKYVIMYDSKTNHVKDIELIWDGRIPIIRILDDIDDIAFRSYKYRDYIMVGKNGGEIFSIYECEFLECAKYFVKERKSGRLDDIAEISENEKAEEQAELIKTDLIDFTLASKIEKVETQLIRAVFAEPFFSLVDSGKILHIIITKLIEMPSNIAKKMVLVKAKKMVPCVIRHRLIELEPIAFTNDGFAIYLVPRDAYLLGEYKAMAIESISHVSLREISMHEVLERIAKKRLS